MKPAKIIKEEKIDEEKELLFFLFTIFLDLEWTFILVGYFLPLTLFRDNPLILFLNKLLKEYAHMFLYRLEGGKTSFEYIKSFIKYVKKIHNKIIYFSPIFFSR